MKKVFFIFLVLNSLMYGKDFSLNQHYKTMASWDTEDVDLQSGNNVVFIHSPTNIILDNKLTSFKLVEKKNQTGSPAEKIEQYVYEDGKLVSKYSKYYETSKENYNYNDENFIISRKIDNYPEIKFSYISDYKRNSYGKNDLLKTECIELKNNGYEVNSYSAKGLIEKKTEYVFLKEKLSTIKTSYFNSKGSLRCVGTTHYIYNKNDLLEKITYENTTLPVSKYWEIEITKYNNTYIKELIYYSYRTDNSLEFKNVYTFSGYDSYGNWTTGNCKRNGELLESYTRIFDYKE